MDQHQLAAETEDLAGNLNNIESQLAAALQRTDGTLPTSIAEKARELMAAIDNRLAPIQLGATYALRKNAIPTAAKREKAAVAAFEEVEKLFDELFQLAIEEMDKLPVQDPIADVLDDPTLDELLAMLENEQMLAAALGIPPRPSNLQIVGDWLRPNQGRGVGAQQRMFIAQQMRRESEQPARANRRSVSEGDGTRSRRTQEGERTPRKRSGGRGHKSTGITLASKLEDELLHGRGKLPPERYRRAIEQYFNLISRAESDEGLGE